jgi:hypothetical protein
MPASTSQHAAQLGKINLDVVLEPVQFGKPGRGVTIGMVLGVVELSK